MPEIHMIKFMAGPSITFSLEIVPVLGKKMSLEVYMLKFLKFWTEDVLCAPGKNTWKLFLNIKVVLSFKSGKALVF